MADNNQQIEKLLALDPLQRLDCFGSFDAETKLTVVKQLYEDHELKELKSIFTRLYPSQLGALLQELDREPSELILKWAGDEQRMAIMFNFFTDEDFNSLQAVLRWVGVDEVIGLLERVPPQKRKAIFNLAPETTQVDILVKFHSDESTVEFQRFVSEMEPADIADLLEFLNQEDRERILSILSPQLQADSLVELQPHVAQELMRSLAVDRLTRLFKLMASDDIAELLGYLEESEQEALLSAMDLEHRAEVTEMLSYEEDSAGLIMNPETCSLPTTATVAEAKRALGRIPNSSDPIFFVFVTETENDTLVGVVPVLALVNAAPGLKLGDICDRDVIFATPDEDQEEIARRFRKYDMWVMPVVDGDKRLIGRITVDDVIDVVHEEADEDLAHLVGAPDIEGEFDRPFLISRKRLPWLLITMFAGLLNGFVIERMTTMTDKIIVLTALAPAIFAMGGNTGMQSSAVCIRGIALGNEKYSRMFSIVWREIRVGATLGIICGTLAGTTIALGLTGMQHLGWLTSGLGSLTPIKIGMIVGAAMFSAMTFASSFGSITPIILHRFGVDPAVASGPFVTTSSDLSAALIYMGICAAMLQMLA